MKVLVTGGAGYVGSILCPMLLDQGHSVTIFDRFLFGEQPVLHFASHPRVTIVEGDVRERQAIAKLVASADCVLHLAAVVGFPACDVDPETAQSTNVEGTRHICDAVSPSQMLIFASTGSVYGRCATVCDETIPAAPLTLYGRSKAEGETLVLDKGGVALRFATLFGLSPRMRLDLLINSFCFIAVRDGVVDLFEGNHKRTFLHVRDGAAAYPFAIEHYAQMAGDVFNIGSDDMNYSKIDIACAIQRFHPFTLREAPIGVDRDARDYVVSHAKIAVLGYRPTIALEEGIQEVLRLVPFLKPRTEWRNAA